MLPDNRQALARAHRDLLSALEDGHEILHRTRFLSAVNWVLNGQLTTTNAWVWDIDDAVGNLQSTNVYRYSRDILLGVNAAWLLGRSGRYSDPFLASVEQRTNELEFTLTYEI